MAGPAEEMVAEGILSAGPLIAALDQVVTLRPADLILAVASDDVIVSGKGEHPVT